MASGTSHQDDRQPPQESDNADENTPLLITSHEQDEERADHTSQSPRSSAASSLLRSIQSHVPGKGSLWKRWPSIIALTILCLVALVILIIGFWAPSVAEEYASQATSFDLRRLSVHSFTKTGVVAHVQGHFSVDGARVQRKPVRDLGRLGTYIAEWAESGNAKVQVRLPEYDNLVLGTADIPPVKVNIRDGHTTALDFLAEVQPGSKDGLRRIANDWIDGRLGKLRIQGEAEVPLKSGLFSLGTQTLSQSLLLGGKIPPSLPEYEIKRLNFREIDLPGGRRGIAAGVSILVNNEYPADVNIPPLGFSILADGCSPGEPHILLADATTEPVHVRPREAVAVNATGFIERLPEAFMNACPGSAHSPFDNLLGGYLHGQKTTVYVQGSNAPSSTTPQWVTDLLYGVSLPVPVPGHTFGHLIKNFTMENVHFSLPDFFAEPGTPEAQPKVSANIKALIALPEEMNFSVDVHRVRSTADVFYHHKKLGILDLQKWHPASSREVKAPKGGHADLEVESDIVKAPLMITDDDVFNDLVSALLTGGSNVILTVKALVDVEMTTALGTFVVRQIPAQGDVPVKPIGGRGDYRSLAPKVGDLKIIDSSAASLTLAALVNITNPTKYSAQVPYADINILVNGTVMGHATVRNLSIERGNNTNIPVTAVWEPSIRGGPAGRAVGAELLSQYISGYNTTLTLQTYEGTLPSQPALGKALSSLPVNVPAPSLGGPGVPGGGKGRDRPHFISDATMHLLSSSATFVLHSPLKRSTIFITHLNATAFYHEDSVGQILYDEQIEVPPGSTDTPYLPVDWSLSSVGYEAIKNALGGTLQLRAFAHVGVRLDLYEEEVWYAGQEIGAKIRI